MLIHDRFVFLHMPKTGGVFLATMLKAELGDGALHSPDDLGQHANWEDIPEYARDRPVLAYIRNPWDWYVSWYHFGGRRASLGVERWLASERYRVLFGGGKNDFATTIRKSCAGLVAPGAGATPRSAGTEDFFTARFLLLCGSGSESGQLTIGRYESMGPDLGRFLASVGVPLSTGALDRIRTAEPVNAGNHRPYRTYYDAELRDLVGSSCRMLIDRFGYGF